MKKSDRSNAYPRSTLTAHDSSRSARRASPISCMISPSAILDGGVSGERAFPPEATDKLPPDLNVTRPGHAFWTSLCEGRSSRGCSLGWRRRWREQGRFPGRSAGQQHQSAGGSSRILASGTGRSERLQKSPCHEREHSNAERQHRPENPSLPVGGGSGWPEPRPPPQQLRGFKRGAPRLETAM